MTFNPPHPTLRSLAMLPALRPLLLGLVVVGASACGTETDRSCDGMPAGLERDVCFGKELKALPAAQIDNVLAIAGKVADPMVRGEAVSSWVLTNGNGVSPEKGQQLCGMLEDRDGAYCLRRLSSPHLQRDH